SATFSCEGMRTSRKPALVMQCAADITVKPPEWLWLGRIAIGKLTLIAGEAGLGKSQVSIAMAGAVTTGGAWPCGEGRAPLGDVIFLVRGGRRGRHHCSAADGDRRQSPARAHHHGCRVG